LFNFVWGSIVISPGIYQVSGGAIGE